MGRSRPFTIHTTKRAKSKAVAYELLVRDSAVGRPMYALLDELVAEYHEDLKDARIALAWCSSWKPDADGRVTLGQCKKASDLDRELAPFDFVILLQRHFWRDDLFVTDDQRRALLDHELMHAALKYDEHGEPAVDERGRKIYRIRKHDLEEFSAIAERHGLWKRDLERFAAALNRRARTQPFEPCDACKHSPNPGWVTLNDPAATRLQRCACWVRWAERRTEAISA
jgi:hypothetical protein